MKIVWKVISHKGFLPLAAVFLFAILASRTLLFQPGYFNMHDDLQMMRQLQMEKCFLDGQIPCRWSPDMGYGFGFPLFNFYPPLPYLIGQGIRLLGFSFITVVKLNFALSILISGVAMYFLAKQFFGRLGGVLSAVFYVWAPYHAVDVFVRGAMNETWALAWFPLIFLFSYKLITTDKKQVSKWVICLTLAYFALLTSHNLMVIIFTPFLGLWVMLCLWFKNAWSRLLPLVISGIWAFGLAAFFTLPFFFENKFTHLESQLEGYYDYTAHFVNIRQLLTSRFWGYGPSVWMDDDEMSFQIGHLHWILSLVVGGFLVFKIAKKFKNFDQIKKDPLLLTTSYLLLVGWFSAFMTHLRSIYIYQAIPVLGYIQFPWRFLTIVIFAFSFVVGFLPALLRSRKGLFDLVLTPFRATITILLIILVVLINWNYFVPEGGRMGPLTDEEKFSGAAWDLQQTAGIYDYLPVYAEVAPTGPQTVLAEIMEGEGEIRDMEQGTYWGRFVADVKSEIAVVRINIFYFPDWRAFVHESATNREIQTFVPEEEVWGRMWIKLPQGEQVVYAQLFNTPVRTYANLISLLSWMIFLGVVVRGYRRRMVGDRLS